MNLEVIVIAALGYMFGLALLAFLVYLVSDMIGAIRHHLVSQKELDKREGGERIIYAKSNH